MSLGYYIDYSGNIKEAFSRDLISNNVIEVVNDDGQIDGVYTYYTDIELLTRKLNEHLY